MNKYKICVYAICKNEFNFVDRWYDSVKEADEVYVLDTGSTDNTVSRLKELGVFVTSEIISPWRFDVARNKSLEVVPLDTDICVCLDLDEVIEKGWRKKLENGWNDKIDRIYYNYNWSFDEHDNPNVSFYIEKIHKRKNYIWKHPVHEVLSYTGNGNEIKKIIESITVNHYPDNSKSRGSYLPLLELSVLEDPNDDRNMHYLGREYMYYEKWDKSIETLKKHLELPSATWKDERSASMRFIARCYKNKNDYLNAKLWYRKSIIEAPHLREPVVELGILEYDNGDYKTSKELFEYALTINKNYKSYINEIFSSDSYLYDMLSLCYFFEDDISKAIEYVDNALLINSNDKRLISNKLIFEKFSI